MIVCHVDRGGAFNVARAYADSLHQDLVVSPSYIQFAKLLWKQHRATPVVFNAPHQTLKFLILVLLLSPRRKIYCVEHFILSQVLKFEFSGFRRKLFLIILKLNDSLKVTPICLDSYAAKVRKRMTGVKRVIIVHNPTSMNDKFEDTQSIQRNYDLIWAGGLSEQKRWPDALIHLCEYKTMMPHKKVAVASYDKPIATDITLMKKYDIEFIGDQKDWYLYSSVLFFTSRYEGYPLVLLEAMQAKMKIIAWCHRSCLLQVGQLYSSFEWQSCQQKFSWLKVKSVKQSINPPRISATLITRHSNNNFLQELEQL
jgi:hypothetical protein